MSHRLFLPPLLLAAALASPACAPDPAAPAPNIVLVVLDTTRPDLLSAYGHDRPTSPFLETFAARGTRFARAWASSSWTLPAHATLFTGALPEVHGATQSRRRVRSALPLIAERLRAAGYQTACFTSNPWVSRKTDLQRGMEIFAEPWKFKFGWLRGELPPGDTRLDRTPLVGRVEEWFAHTVDPARPWFLFVNLMEPHEPLVPSLRSARKFLDVESEEALRELLLRVYPQGQPDLLIRRHYDPGTELTPEDWELLQTLYEAALHNLDHVVAQLFALVDGAEGGREILAVIVSDHGENLGEHGHLGHMFNLYDSNLRVALMARGPGFAPGRVVAEHAHLMDVCPTLLAAAGLAVPPEMPGVDLRGALPRDRILTASLDYPSLSLKRLGAGLRESAIAAPFKRVSWAAVGPRYKLIAGSDGREELFDLIADPDEAQPLAPTSIDPAALAALRAAVRRVRDVAAETRAAEGEVGPEPVVDEEIQQALRELGYIE